MDKRVYLKVKLKSLAEEARIIRKQEMKKTCWREGLYRHRIDVVRPEARNTLLAYSFIRGKAYKEIEPNAKTQPDWLRVKKLVERYGVCGYYDYNPSCEVPPREDVAIATKEQAEKLEQWVKEAQASVAQR